MIITVASKHGAGKSTAVNLLLEALPGMHKLDISRKFRELAQERGMNIDDFVEFLTNNPEESKKIDRDFIEPYQKQEIAKGNVVVDSNLGAMLAPNADLKVFLECDLNTRAKRVLEGGKRYADKEASNFEEMKKQLIKRDENDRQRYLRLYDFDIFNVKNYDLIINTNETTKKEVVQKILDALNKEELKK